MSTVHVILPGGVDDPTRPSGGNTYDRQVCAGLSGLGWTVRRHLVPGGWPAPDGPSSAAVAALLAGIPDGSTVLLDGLVASAAPDALCPEAGRLRLVVLVHLPLGHGPGRGAGVSRRRRESEVLTAAAAVVATSRWTRDWLLAAYQLQASRVHVVPPGVAPAELVSGSATGERLVCVGAVTSTKGHDVLVEALAEVAELGWSGTCVGSVAVDPAFADRVTRRARAAGLADRLAFPGALVGTELDAVYAAADLLIAPSRAESFGMAATEALARGIPVVGSDVGGLPEALGDGKAERAPGILVPPGDATALAGALRRWLTDVGARDRLRRAAAARRATLDDWSVTVAGLSRLLSGVSA